MGSLLLASAIVIAFIIGISSQFVTNRDDAIVEEVSEEFIETQIEKALDLKKDSIDIDFSPGEEVKNV